MKLSSATTTSLGESRSVLIFVVVPLLVAVVVGLILRMRSRHQLAVAYPGFSFQISALGHEQAFVTYSTGTHKWHFDAGLYRSKQIEIRLPGELQSDIARQVAENLALGLVKLGYRYVIYQPENGIKLSHRDSDE